jgi:hypothetical protein
MQRVVDGDIDRDEDKMETIHLYIVKEQPKRPNTFVPLFCAFLCLVFLAADVWYSAEHPYYEHERLSIPAQYLPLKIFRAETPIIPTGIKTYPATYAHGWLTFSNGSIIGQSVPAGFIIDNVSTNYAVYVPPATPDSFGIARVAAHLLVAGTNLSTMAINEVIGSSLFIRNLSPFTGGHPAYSVKFVTAQDKQSALTTARNILAMQINGYHYPCQEFYLQTASVNAVTWRCRFVTYKVPSYMHVTQAKLLGRSFLVEVWFIPLPKAIWRR